jgi:hypothetical protein
MTNEDYIAELIWRLIAIVQESARQQSASAAYNARRQAEKRKAAT